MGSLATRRKTKKSVDKNGLTNTKTNGCTGPNTIAALIQMSQRKKKKQSFWNRKAVATRLLAVAEMLLWMVALTSSWTSCKWTSFVTCVSFLSRVLIVLQAFSG